MSAVTTGLHLLDLGQDLLEAGIVEVAGARAAAVNAQRGGSSNYCRENSERNHFNSEVSWYTLVLGREPVAMGSYSSL